jgi:hypothetical protein
LVRRAAFPPFPDDDGSQQQSEGSEDFEQTDQSQQSGQQSEGTIESQQSQEYGQQSGDLGQSQQSQEYGQQSGNEQSGDFGLGQQTDKEEVEQVYSKQPANKDKYSGGGSSNEIDTEDTHVPWYKKVGKFFKNGYSHIKNKIRGERDYNFEA